MRRGVRRRLIAALAVALIAAASTTLVTRPAGGGNGLVQGFALWPNQSPTEYQRVAATGANTVYLDVWWLADSPDANSVHPTEGTTSDASIIADIQKAAALGMQVTLMPKVSCKGCTYGWRGDLDPADPHAFLASYREMVDHYAALGQQHGLSLLFLGSEMNHLQQYGDDWREIVTSVRQTGFRGPITYQPNWDRTDDVAFWGALDLVAVSAYFPLTPTKRPSVAEIKAGWRSSAVPGWWKGQDWFAKLQGLARQTGKDVLIGEVGYRSSETATAYPYEEWASGTPDQTTQANAYQALLETFSNQSWWRGVIWWQWRGTDQDANSSDMSPKGKAAEQLLTRWWAQGWRPVPGSGTTNGGTGRPAAAPAPGRATGVVTRSPGTSNAVPGSTAAPGTTGSTAAPSNAQGLVDNGGAGDSAAINAPRSVARLAHSNDRGALVAVALVALLGVGVAVGNQVRVLLRTSTPRPLF